MRRSRSTKARSNSIRKRSRSKSRSGNTRRNRSRSRNSYKRSTMKARIRSPRSVKWEQSIRKSRGNKFYEKLERCVLAIKDKNKKNGTYYNPYAVCFASLQGKRS